jgi:hypothetical protein
MTRRMQAGLSHPLGGEETCQSTPKLTKNLPA